MNYLIICFFIALIASCGKQKSNSIRQKDTNANQQAACMIKMHAADIPSAIAVKAFRMQTECGLKSEEDLEKRLKDV